MDDYLTADQFSAAQERIKVFQPIGPPSGYLPRGVLNGQPAFYIEAWIGGGCAACGSPSPCIKDPRSRKHCEEELAVRFGSHRLAHAAFVQAKRDYLVNVERLRSLEQAAEKAIAAGAVDKRTIEVQQHMIERKSTGSALQYAADAALRFLAGVRFEDHPIAEQKECLRVVHELIAILRPGAK